MKLPLNDGQFLLFVARYGSRRRYVLSNSRRRWRITLRLLEVQFADGSYEVIKVPNGMDTPSLAKGVYYAFPCRAYPREDGEALLVLRADFPILAALQAASTDCDAPNLVDLAKARSARSL